MNRTIHRQLKRHLEKLFIQPANNFVTITAKSSNDLEFIFYFLLFHFFIVIKVLLKLKL